MKKLSIDNLKINLADLKLNFDNLVKLEIAALILTNIIVFWLFSGSIGRATADKRANIASLEANIAQKVNLSSEEKIKAQKNLESSVEIKNGAYDTLQKRVELIQNNVIFNEDASVIVDKIIKLPYAKEKVNVSSVNMQAVEDSDQGMGGFMPGPTAQFQKQNVGIQLEATYKDLIEYLAQFKKLDLPLCLASVNITVFEYPKLQINLTLFTLTKAKLPSGEGMFPGPPPRH